MNRDDTYHGMQFEVSTGTLEFFGVASTYLMEQKQLLGIFANVTFIAQIRCDDDEFVEVVRDRLNFGKYKDTCGSTKCTVTIPFEEEGCKVTFKNRFEQKVDIEKEIALDNSTPLPSYAQMGRLINMPAVALKSAVDGSTADSGYTSTTNTSLPAGLAFLIMFYRPDYEIERYNNITTGQLIGINNCEHVAGATSTDCEQPITPQLLFEDSIKCFNGTFEYT